MIWRSRTGGVNLLHLAVPSYGEVQGQIFDLIAEQLPEQRVTQTIDRPVSGALNTVLHIRLGKGERQVPPPAQVLMSHGLADKSYLFLRHATTGQPLLNSFDHVLVPGEFLRQRVLRRMRSRNPALRVTLPPDHVHVVGWPRLDPLVQAGEAGRRPDPARPLRVLWAPSHDTQRVGAERRRLSSYPAFEEHLPRLQERFDVRVSLHPRNRTAKSPTTGDLAWADVVIADFGTLLYEAWALGRCVVLPTWLVPPEIVSRSPRSAEAVVYRERIGNHASSIGELVEMVAAAEPPGTDVRSFLDQHLAPQYFGTSSRRIAQVLDDLAPRYTWRDDLRATVAGALPPDAGRRLRRAQGRLRRALPRSLSR